MRGCFKEVVIGLAFAVFGGNANAFYQQCAGCSATQMQASAQHLGPGTWLVWNPTNGNVRKYEVTCGSVNSTPLRSYSDTTSSTDGAMPTTDATTTCHPLEVAVPQGVLDVAAKLLALSQATAGSYSAEASVHASDFAIPLGPQGPTAFDYLVDKNYRGQLNKRIAIEGLSRSSNGYTAGLIEYLKNHADATLNFTDGIQSILTVQFDDGSKVDVLVTLLSTVAVYVESSAEDSRGQVLPDHNTADNTGRWFYPSSDQNGQRMVNMLHAMGAEVIVGTQQQGFLNCSWDAVSTRLTCHWSSY